MGFDLYGMNPVVRDGYSEPKRPEYPGHPGEYNAETSSITEEEHIQLIRDYFRKRDSDPEFEKSYKKFLIDLGEYEDNNPGVYFRSNVWYWRPIVDWLLNHIEVLDEDDSDGLSHNSGYIINKNVATIIGSTIESHHEQGLLQEWVQKKKVEQLMRGKEPCTICDGTGVRTDLIGLQDLEPFVKDGVRGGKCNGCNGEGLREPFDNNYPYSEKALVDFGIFAKESGGFQIC